MTTPKSPEGDFKSPEGDSERNVAEGLEADIGDGHAFVDEGDEQPHDKDHRNKNGPDQHFCLMPEVHEFPHDIRCFYDRHAYEEPYTGILIFMRYHKGNGKFDSGNDTQYQGYPPELSDLLFIWREDCNRAVFFVMDRFHL